MLGHLRANLWLLVLTLLLCSVVYPLTVWAIGQTVFRDKAQGSLVHDKDGKPIGSRLIAQPFTGDGYFQPRPSAVSYNAAASGASNWAASNPNLRKRVEEDVALIQKQNPAMQGKSIPADMVMASGSGLDPHITLDNALYQLDRVAAKRAEKTKRDPIQVRAEIEEMLQEKAAAPLGGLVGVKLVNVLECQSGPQCSLR